MRLVFMGTPDYAIPVLSALLEAGHEVVGVYTQPDKPAGRGREVVPPPVKRYALERGLPIFQPPSLRQPKAVDALRALAPEAIVVSAYGKLLPPEVLHLPPLGCLNLHPSLLPRWRGPAPIVFTLLEGDSVTGVTIILLDEGMDTGPILAQVQEPVRPDDTARTLTERLFRLGAGLMVETLERWGRGEVTPQPQDEARATVTRLIRKEDGRMDFSLPAVRLERMVRAFDPWPSAWTTWKGKVLKVLRAVVVDAPAPTGPGEVVALPPGGPAPVAVGTGEGLLGLLRLHLEGGRPLEAEAFLRGHRDFVGSRLPS